MANFTKLILSGSVDGRNIRIVATATPGTTIHTATASTGSDSCDEVYLWAGSTSASYINMTVQTSDSADMASYNVRVPPAYAGLIPVIPGFPYRNGVVLTATASSPVNISGFVNRISAQ